MVKAYYTGDQLEEMILIDEIHTAEESVRLVLNSDRDELHANGADMAFITVELRDKNGIINMQAQKNVTIEVEGAGTVQGYGNADPYFQGTYQQETIPTFEGRVQAAVRAGYEAGEVTVRFMADGCETVEMKLPVKGC